MTPPRRTPSLLLPLYLGALALFGLVGCVTDPDDSELAAARSEGPLAASPGTAAFGRLGVGSSGELSVQLDNSGRSEIIIRGVSLVPPDPYAPEYVPSSPCIPPDPYHNPPDDLPPDPYHNPAMVYAPDANLTTRLIAPCVKPGGSTVIGLGFYAKDAGGFAAGIRIEYATEEGGAFALTVPATACIVR